MRTVSGSKTGVVQFAINRAWNEIAPVPQIGWKLEPKKEITLVFIFRQYRRIKTSAAFFIGITVKR